MASLIENLKSWFAPPAPPPVRNQGYHHLTGEIFGESLPQAGLPALNERSALAISAVYAAVNLIAGTIATMPVQVYARQADGERDRCSGGLGASGPVPAAARRRLPADPAKPDGSGPGPGAPGL